jgi:hypothetical protein
MPTHTSDHPAKADQPAKSTEHSTAKSTEHAPKPAPGAPPVAKDEVELTFNLVGITHRLRTKKVAERKVARKTRDDNVDLRRGPPIDAVDYAATEDGLSIYDGYAEALGRWLLSEAATSFSVNPVVQPEQPSADR